MGGLGGCVEQSTCHEQFSLVPNQYCIAEGGDLSHDTSPCELEAFKDGNYGWNMKTNCATNGTLALPDLMLLFTGNGNTLTFTGDLGDYGWVGGRAALTSETGKGRISLFNIVVDDSALADPSVLVSENPDVYVDPCNAVGRIETAIWLNGALPNGGSPFPQAVDNEIRTPGNLRLCYGIDTIGDLSNTTQIGAVVQDNTVHADSYVKAGIRSANHDYSDAQDSGSGGVGGNRVHSTTVPCAAGILIGPAVERGGVEDNVIDVSPSGNGCSGVGIAIVSSGASAPHGFQGAEPIQVSGNTIVNADENSIGAGFGALVNAATQENVLSSGDPVDGADTGFCAENGAQVDFATKRKRLDTFIGFDPPSEIKEGAADCIGQF